MKELRVNHYSEIPKNYTGKIVYPNGSKYWYLNGIIYTAEEWLKLIPNPKSQLFNLENF